MIARTKSLRQLLRLRDMRRDLAQIAVQHARAALVAASDHVGVCEQAIADCAADGAALEQAIRDSPFLYAVQYKALTEARQANLKARAERAVEALREAEDARSVALQDVANALAVLAQATARRDGVAEQARVARARYASWMEEQQMLELDGRRVRLQSAAR